MDLAQRPELRYGSIEFVAPGDYCHREPKPITYVFAMNVSLVAIRSGLLNYYIASIKRVLNHFTKDPRFDQVRFGLVTFDTSVQFYNLDVSYIEEERGGEERGERTYVYKTCCIIL
jgi:protein transport protein SEC24